MSNKLTRKIFNWKEDRRVTKMLSQSEFKDSLREFFGGTIDYFDTLRDAFPLEDTLYSYNEDGSLNITIEVPGIKYEDLNVSIHDQEGGGALLKVRGEITINNSVRSVNHTCSIPEGYFLEGKHSLENGLFTITFPVIK